jgi:hypothetical protein
MSQPKAVSKATSTRYQSASKSAKAVILDELRDHGLTSRLCP